MSVPIQNTMHVAQGLSRLCSAFITKPNIRAILAVYLQPAQDLENAIWGVLLGRVLSTALVGVGSNNPVFDTLGALVGQPRLGLIDSDYKGLIYLRVAVNRATGRVSDWSNFANILLAHASDPVPSYYEGEAAFFLGIWGLALSPAVVAQALAQAAANGVNMVFSYSTWPDGNDFEWADDPPTVGEGPFGDDIGGLVGGLLVA
jgi:hypothetical protein